MISKMTKYSFILLSGEKEHFIDSLQEIGLVDITRSDKPVDDRSAELLRKANETREAITQAKKEAEGLSKELADARRQVEILRPWGAFNPGDLKRIPGYGIHFYLVDRKKFRPEWAEQYPLQIISEEGKQVHFVLVLPDGADNPLPVPELTAPQQDYRGAEAAAEALEARVKKASDDLQALKANSRETEETYREQMARLDQYLATVAADPAAEDTIATFTGYAVSENDAALKEQLDKLDAFYLAEPATVEDNPPIELKNNKFTGMFKVLTDMYGRPGYDGFDPTPFLSIFFLLFFAMCMGDAGYGLVLIIVGLLLKKVESFRDMAPLVETLGIGTVIVGFFMHTFFSIDIAQWEMFAPVKGIFLPSQIAGYDGAMVLSLIIGVVHLCLAMVVKTWQETKNKGFLHSLGTWGWTLLIVGGVTVGAFALAGVIDAALTKWILIGLGILSALGIFLFNTPGRNPLLNIGSGLWDTYNTATGLLGDVLSYLRLYALGLAGAMLGYAFNDLGKMVLRDGGVGNWIGFLAIVIIGHTLNIAMCALGAFVHPLRLNFLEFFKNSGYEGSGRNFRPLTK